MIRDLVSLHFDKEGPEPSFAKRCAERILLVLFLFRSSVSVKISCSAVEGQAGFNNGDLEPRKTLRATRFDPNAVSVDDKLLGHSSKQHLKKLSTLSLPWSDSLSLSSSPAKFHKLSQEWIFFHCSFGQQPLLVNDKECVFNMKSHSSFRDMSRSAHHRSTTLLCTSLVSAN